MIDYSKLIWKVKKNHVPVTTNQLIFYIYKMIFHTFLQTRESDFDGTNPLSSPKIPKG